MPDIVAANATPPALLADPAAGKPEGGLAARWNALPGRTQLMAVVAVLALLAVLAALAGTVREGEYRALFGTLSEKDGGQVIERLTQMNVPYRFAEGGATILVPASRVHELRMKLAAAGLPAGGAGGTHAPGYELLDKSPFGQTQGQERMNVQRAIEGELTRTIQSLQSVQSARVHLALPQMNGFFREQQKPSASVVLSLHPGRTLERAQIAGIVHLVSSSVPELSPKAVSVIDGSGTLLSSSGDAEADGLDSQQLQFRRDIEAAHLQRVMALLEPVVGRDNLRASVSADIDFSQVMQTAEVFGPNQGADARAAVREQRTEESTQPGSATPAGVPGATTNQPPVPATAPINGQAQALQGAGATAGSSRREGATRYEVDKTTTVTRNAVGTVRRLSAAVVVNHRTNIDAKGKSNSAPLPEKELEQLTTLVQQAIGFNAERGDVVRVINAPFRAEPAPKVEPTPLWQQPWLQDLVRSAAAPAALALVAVLIVFALLRPALKPLLAPQPAPPGTQLSEVVDDGPPTPPPTALPQLEAPRDDARLAAARALAKQNPQAVAEIVRGWVSGEGT
ncbi:MAG: flagellar basal-body MS-ring/collar protein FliF [Pseudomonadota bacterium]|jgi:flagellar M-ring protein FliF|nr:flagellar M-ring protein FliF [Rubrivivax sp.]MCA3257498.1 flagellar M-ring protein FliF [Rubrivivax sp.]MCE2912414.1 flagellar M-ring protein FliF [Rubrivivax sp.]MCZ8029874.1 flagellar basal-body MS-ring/collar protein FliF [Rubrivivax sp.]